MTYLTSISLARIHLISTGKSLHFDEIEEHRRTFSSQEISGK
jgi:hypothetical protein